MKEIKTTVGKCYEIGMGLHHIKSLIETAHPRLGYKLSYNTKALSEVLLPLEEVKKELLEKYGTKEPREDNPEEFDFVIKAEDKEKFYNELTKVTEQETTVKLYEISLTELEELKVSFHKDLFDMIEPIFIFDVE